MNTTGITYNTTGDRNRARIAGYHGKPQPREMHKTKHAVDVAGLKPAQRARTLVIQGTDIVSKFTVGFEVEKTSLHRDAVREYELFCGFETDSSCGYEAVTNILPLLPACLWRNKVYDMMFKAEKIIDDRFSPSDLHCGGHINVGVKGVSSASEIREKVRKYSGILFALFRNRLSNNYCGHNLTMLPEDTSADRDLHFAGYASKYQACKLKSFINYNPREVDYFVEFRIPSRFSSVKQMMRRYELIYEIFNFAFNKPNSSHTEFINAIRPIVESMYKGDENESDKIAKVFELEPHFQRFINTGKVNQAVQLFVDPLSIYTERWEAGIQPRATRIGRR